MRRFLRYQRNILRKSVPVAIIYVTGLLYVLYIAVAYFFKRPAAIHFAEEELIVVVTGVIVGAIIHRLSKRRSYRTRLT